VEMVTYGNRHKPEALSSKLYENSVLFLAVYKIATANEWAPKSWCR